MLNAASIFSYVAWMVLDFGLVDNRDEVGFYAGFLGGSFFAGQFASSYAWGVLSDRYGKRICLIAGSTGTLITCLAFGFSFSFWFAVLTRFLGGLLNGNIGIAKAYIGVATTKESAHKAFGLFGLMWGVGALAGSFYGGLLARVAVKWGDVFDKNGIFGRFPYLLPNLITSFFIVVALILTYFFLTEPPVKESKKKVRNCGACKNKVALQSTSAYG